MKRTVKLIVICSAIFFVSCEDKTEYDKFKQLFSEKINLQGTILSHDDNLLGNPTDLRVLDSLLIFLDPGSDTHLIAVNKNCPDTAYHLLPKGKGAYEYGLVRGIEIDHIGNICFFDDNSNNYIETPVTLKKSNIPPVYTVNLKFDFGKILNVTRFGDKLFSTGIFNREKRFVVCENQKDNEISKTYLIGEYPKDSYSNIPNLKRGMAYQTRLRKNEANHVIVAYNLMAGEIKFFDFDNDSIVLKKDFVFNLPKYTPESVGISVTFVSSHSSVSNLVNSFGIFEISVFPQ